jgi:diguanylate cyclase (GGDEF)-like protein
VQMELLLYIFALFISCVFACFIALIAFHRRNKKGSEAVAIACITLAMGIYSLGYAFELASSNLSSMIFWSRFQYAGISVIPALWIIIVIQFTGKSRWLTRPVVAALFIIPALTFVLHLTDSFHQLFYHAYGIDQNSPYLLLSFIPGPWYWVNAAYINLSLLTGNIMLLHWWRTAPLYRSQTLLIILATLIPWIGFIAYLIVQPPWGLDLTPFTFALTGLIVIWGLHRNQLFALIPIARDQVFDSMRDGVIVLDNDNRIVDFNPAAQLIIKKLSMQTIGMTFQKVLEDCPGVFDQLSKVDDENSLQKRCKGTNYHYSVKSTQILSNKKKLLGQVIVLSDITNTVELVERLRQQANVDWLTGIFNRRHFIYLCKRELSLASQYKQPLAIIIMDLDIFKLINDTFGHKAGDTVMKSVVDICIKNLRVTDIFGRYGGDEFVIFLPGTTSEQAVLIADRLRQNIAAARIVLEDQPVSITASFGIHSVTRAVNLDFDALLKSADEALCKAKRDGGNCIYINTPESRSPRPAFLSMKNNSGA